jgi:hypothetical protein
MSQTTQLLELEVDGVDWHENPKRQAMAVEAVGRAMRSGFMKGFLGL